MPPPETGGGVGHSFLLELDGAAVGLILDVAGVTIRPGGPARGEVTLVRPLTRDRTFLDWAEAAGPPARQVVVRVLDTAGAPLRTCTLTNARPSTMDITAGEPAVLERLTLAHDALTVD